MFRRRQILLVLVSCLVLTIYATSHVTAIESRLAGVDDPTSLASDAHFAVGENTISGPSGGAIGLQRFDLVTAEEGWVSSPNQLYWTHDRGQNWYDITPAAMDGFTIHAVVFPNLDDGWLVSSRIEPGGAIDYAIATTSDGGRSWKTHPVDLFVQGDPDAFASGIYLQFIDSMTGWLMTRRATSSNFDVGALFATVDGGVSWERRTLPVGGPAQFLDRNVGWIAGGVRGDELYRTDDGGRTWQLHVLDAHIAEPVYGQLRFQDNNYGLLPVLVNADEGARIEFYASDENGRSWQRAVSIDAEGELTQDTPLTLSGMGDGNWLTSIPETGRLILVSETNQVSVVSADGATPDAFTDLDMATATVGWAREVVGTCSMKLSQPSSPSMNGAGTRECTLAARLLGTENGGSNWAEIALPEAMAHEAEVLVAQEAPSTASVDVSNTPSDQTVEFQGQGFDKCEIPTISQLQTWRASSPYGAVNLYIGGSARACANSALTSSYVAQIAQQGWKFIPTWVGPQAPCSGYSSRFSYDAGTAYIQGRSEADLAITAASALGLTQANQNGSVLYYDMEGYDTSNSACRNAVNSFISGWTSRVRERDNQAGVYGSSCSTAISDFATISNVPDVVWIASWLTPYQYRSDATVWGISCLSDGLWTNHHRIRQYAGGHNETWGGVTLNIDSNVSDGVVAALAGDITPPEEAFIDGPANNAVIQGTLNLDGWANDQESGIDRVEVWLDGVFEGNAIYGIYRPDLGANVGFHWEVDSTQYFEGTHTLLCRFYDNSGNSTDLTRSILFDNNVPPATPGHLTPQNQEWIKSNAVTFTWQDNGDPDNGPWADRSFSAFVSPNSDCSSPSAGVGWLWSGSDFFQTTWSTTLADATYYWCLYAYDGSEGSGWSSARAFNVETSHNVAWLSDNTPSGQVTPASYTVAVQIKNTGSMTWPATGTNTVHLSYHWIDSGGNTVVYDGVRTNLPSNIGPNDTVVLNATLEPPSLPGDYMLMWDMVEEGVTWFSQKGAPTRGISVHVAPNVPPNLPVFDSPPPGATLMTLPVTFSWQDGGDPDNQPHPLRDYSLLVATDSGFSDLIAGVGWLWESGTLYTDTSWTTILPADGTYYWKLYAYDGGSGSGWTPPRSFVVDTTPPPPNTTIDSYPSDPTSNASASFEFSANQSGCTFECSLDDAVYSNCASPVTYSGLSEGLHTFRVRARNQAGVLDPTPASYSWTIEPLCYTLDITVDPENGGAVNRDPSPDCPDGVRYRSGTEVMLTAVPEAGSVFAGWTGSVTGMTNPAWLTMSEDSSVSAAFAGQITISNVRMSNVRARSFSIGWITDQATTGHVRFGTDPASLTQTAYDDRGAPTSDDTHYVTLTGLLPLTTYYFDVFSGQTVDNNQGIHYSVTTGPELSPPASDTIFGQVFKADGTTYAGGAVVYVSVADHNAQGNAGQSRWLSALASASNGYWFLNLAEARTIDGLSYFAYSVVGDNTVIEVEGASDCQAFLFVDTGNDSPVANIALSCVRSATLSLGAGWSLMGLPLVPEISYAAQSLLSAVTSQGGSCSEIDRWLNGGWDAHINGLPFNDFSVQAGQGYFVKCAADSSWMLQGQALTSGVPIDLQPGWNLVSLPYPEFGLSAQSVLDSIAGQGGACSEIDQWRYGGWDAHIAGLPFNNFAVESDQGYFVKCSVASTFEPQVVPQALSQVWPEIGRMPDLDAASNPHIEDVLVTNRRDVALSVVWRTDLPSNGWIEYGPTPELGQLAYDDRGEAAVSTAHHVTLVGLQPQMTTYFKLHSGSTTADDQGRLFQAMTTATGVVATPVTAFGQVKDAEGTPAIGTVVVAQILNASGESSEPLSALVDNWGYWAMSLNLADCTDDRIVLQLVGPYEDVGKLTVPACSAEHVQLQMADK